MNIDKLRQQFPNEEACRRFFESVLWNNTRCCPHCGCIKSYPLKSDCIRPGLYECAQCKRQFTVTCHTPMHSTKLDLWKWLLAMFLIVNSSKGISSVYLGKLVGISQKSAWKLGHAIRKMMEPDSEFHPRLKGIVELDEKYVGGKPRYQKGAVHKRGKGTDKQCVFVAVQRQGPARTTPVDSDSVAALEPVVDRFVNKSSHLMTDELKAYKKIGQRFDSHQSVNHGKKEYARGAVHNNTAESFSAIVERAKEGVFHYWSKDHMRRYLHEIEFRWNHREPKVQKTRKGKLRIVMKPLPVIEMLASLLSSAPGRQVRRSSSGGIFCFNEV